MSDLVTITLPSADAAAVVDALYHAKSYGPENHPNREAWLRIDRMLTRELQALPPITVTREEPAA